MQETFWDSFGSRSSFKRASRSIAKTGSFCVFVLSVFFSSVSGGSFFSFFEFSVGFGGPKGGHFWTFIEKKRIFHEKVAPSFLHTFTAFWLDFEGVGPPGVLKKREKTAPGKSCFFGLKRKVNKFVFW